MPNELKELLKELLFVILVVLLAFSGIFFIGIFYKVLMEFFAGG